MANEFYVQVVDAQGNVVPNKGFAVYPTYADAQAGTNALTTTPTPLTTNSNGERSFTVSDANRETVYMKVTGETYVEGVRCSNRPLASDYTELTAASVDGSNDLILIWDNSATAYKKITIAQLASAIATTGLFVKTEADAGNTVSTIFSGNTTPTANATGDLWVQPGS